MDSPVMTLFDSKPLIKICAPMVRYSKLEFRTLVRRYNCDLCFTPMIISESFVSSEAARQVEFKTNQDDKPLIVQFAARNAEEFVTASELVVPYCDGVDLNCGCPQKWAMKDGYGAFLLSKPDIIRDVVRQFKNRLPSSKTLSVKLRLTDNINDSVQMCQNLEAAGASFLTVHGRTPKQRCEPVNIEALRIISDSIQIPLVANGDIRTLDDAYRMQNETGCKGVMSARGILQNPAMYSGEPVTPKSCVQDWLDICSQSTIPFQWFHHHLVFMLEKKLPKYKRRVFNSLNNLTSVIDYLTEHLGIVPPKFVPEPEFYSTVMYKNQKLDDGQFFKSLTKEEDFEDYMEDSCISLL